MNRFTGKYDRAGVSICEGDRIHYRHAFDPMGQNVQEFNATVVMVNGRWGFTGKTEHDVFEMYPGNEAEHWRQVLVTRKAGDA